MDVWPKTRPKFLRNPGQSVDEQIDRLTPGWWVEQPPAARGSDLWVLNPKALVAWIAREPEIPSAADAAMATLHLQQHVRNSSPG
jgi:hypothetical protein